MNHQLHQSQRSQGIIKFDFQEHCLLLVLHLLYWFVVQKLLVRLYYKVSQLFLMFSCHPAALFKLFLTDSTDLFYSMHFLNNFMVPLCFLFCLDLSLLCSCIHLASELFFSLCLDHVNIASIQVIFRYFSIIIKNCELVMLL